MNEKYHFGFELLYKQRIYDFDLIKEKEHGSIVAIRKDNILREYDFFGENGIADKTTGILSDIIQSYERRKKSNEKRLFERFLQNWGFLNTDTKKLSIDQFWDEINKIAVLLKRYSTVINGNLEDMVKWIEVRKLGELHSDKWPYRLLNDIPAIEAGYTHEITGSEKQHRFQTKVNDEDLERTPIPYYQFWGFNFITWSVEEKIEWKPSFHKISIKQNKPYLPIEELKGTPTWIPNDLLTCLYTLVFILVSKRQKVCAACYCPFNPSRPDTKYCSETCSNRVKKQRLRERMREI
ncbi:CGNR zinc finger domain-containing protein [Bacillus cabrialesii]|uniref:CGNR zinc finger domain-containing protein n=1 Tax=Bacillus cabrialesii TaxID=2487276 RepID=UPI00101396FE|nr:CGNR zinc finger domain-containing protein [Bacillus cabrialesii]UQE80242.1 CGNR zinc finger domain-containing protein [Bacillus cabrialesii]